VTGQPLLIVLKTFRFIIRVIRPRKMWWVEYVACVRKEINKSIEGFGEEI
jgi:hypothetical protein